MRIPTQSETFGSRREPYWCVIVRSVETKVEMKTFIDRIQIMYLVDQMIGVHARDSISCERTSYKPS